MERQTALMVENLELESLPGWVSLNGDDQLALRRDTAGIVEARKAQGFAAVQEAQFLLHAKQILEKQGWGLFSGYVKRLYPQSERTAYKRLEDYADCPVSLVAITLV